MAKSGRWRERENDRAHFLITLPPHHGAPRISSFLLRVLFHVFDVTCATTRGDIYIYKTRRSPSFPKSPAISPFVVHPPPPPLSSPLFSLFNETSLYLSGVSLSLSSHHPFLSSPSSFRLDINNDNNASASASSLIPRAHHSCVVVVADDGNKNKRGGWCCIHFSLLRSASIPRTRLTRRWGGKCQDSRRRHKTDYIYTHCRSTEAETCSNARRYRKGWSDRPSRSNSFNALHNEPFFMSHVKRPNHRNH